MSRKKQVPRFEPWGRDAEIHEIHDQETHPLPVIPLVLPTPAVLQQNRERFRQLKAVSEASGVRLLFVYLWIERGRHIIRHPDAEPRITKALCQLEEQGLL